MNLDTDSSIKAVRSVIS